MLCGGTGVAPVVITMVAEVVVLVVVVELVALVVVPVAVPGGMVVVIEVVLTMAVGAVTCG